MQVSLSADEEVGIVSEPEAAQSPETGSWQRSRSEVLTAARPLPPEEDALIDGLTDDEDRLFLTAISEA